MGSSGRNVLPAGVSPEQVETAIVRSGYPLQFIVGNQMSQQYEVQSEWGYRDRTTEEMRAIDLLARRRLYEMEESNARRVRPEIALLIECKRSELPYVFFSEASGRLSGEFPHIAGLPSNDIVIRTDDDQSTWHNRVLDALSLAPFDPFLQDPVTCTTLSKCVRKGGSELVLSGTEAYQSLVLPLRSAVEYFRQSLLPKPTYYYFTASIVIGLVVIDAPLISATLDDSGKLSTQMTQWQRLWRHEPLVDEVGVDIGGATAIDIVHRDFLTTYLSDHLEPFAERFRDRALRNDEVLATGKAFARGMGRDSFSSLESRLQPRTVALPPPPLRVEPEGERLEGLAKLFGDLSRDVARAVARLLRLRWNQRRRPHKDDAYRG
jgi:hypothetical protein